MNIYLQSNFTMFSFFYANRQLQLISKVNNKLTNKKKESSSFGGNQSTWFLWNLKEIQNANNNSNCQKIVFQVTDCVRKCTQHILFHHRPYHLHHHPTLIVFSTLVFNTRKWFFVHGVFSSEFNFFFLECDCKIGT